MSTRPDDFLPPGWVAASAAEVCEKIQDGTHFSPKVQLSDGKYRYVTAKNVRPNGLDLSDITYLGEEDHRAIYARCDARRNDVLLVKDGVNAGDAAINTVDDEISLLSSVCFLRPIPELLTPAFLRFYLQNPMSFRTLTGSMSGTAIRRIVLHRVKELPVVVAPLPEQHRIVAAIEDHFSRLDAAMALLERVQRNLKRYRASVLKAAVEGRLVPTEADLARAEGRAYEPASVLLERILDERWRRWKAEVGRGTYKEPVAPDTTGLPELPEGWCWASVDQLAFDVRYGSSEKTDESLTDGVPVIRMGNLIDGALDFGVLKYLPADHEEFPDLFLQPGDLLFNRTNSAELVGKSAVFRLFTGPVSFASYLIRVRFVAGVLPEYVAAFINSLAGRAWIASVAVQQVGQANVNGTKLKACAIPLPPEAEQIRIGAEMDRLISVLKASEQSTGATLTRAARLRQSILKWAFEGRLADQDPTDEPAEGLLERIRGERAAGSGARPGRRGRPLGSRLLMEPAQGDLS